VIATDGVGADLIAQEIRRAPVYFFGWSARLRLHGCLPPIWDRCA
jgi:hypothetical protein